MTTGLLRRAARFGALALVAAYVLATIALASSERRLVFPVPPPRPLGPLPPGVVQIDACGSDGVRCLYAPAAPGQPTVVAFHGNGEQLADLVWMVRERAGSRLMKDRFDSLSKASAVKIPALVVHGTHDDVIPFDQGRTLAAHLHATFLAVPGADHRDILQHPGVMEAIERFAAGG